MSTAGTKLLQMTTGAQRRLELHLRNVAQEDDLESKEHSVDSLLPFRYVQDTSGKGTGTEANFSNRAAAI